MCADKSTVVAGRKYLFAQNFGNWIVFRVVIKPNFSCFWSVDGKISYRGGSGQCDTFFQSYSEQYGEKICTPYSDRV